MDSTREILEAIRGLTYSPKLVEVVSEKIVISTDAYGIADVVSESTSAGTPWVFHGVAKKNGGSGRIHDALILAETTNIASWFSLFLHTDTPTCELKDKQDNTAFLLADRNIAVVRIDFSACDDIGTGMSEATATPSTVGKLPKVFVCKSDSVSLHGVLAIRNAVDLADRTILRIALLIEQF